MLDATLPLVSNTHRGEVIECPSPNDGKTKKRGKGILCLPYRPWRSESEVQGTAQDSLARWDAEATEARDLGQALPSLQGPSPEEKESR